MDDSFIYLKNNSISKDLCSEIIYLFENEKNLHYPGETSSGYLPDIKKTIDLSLHNFFDGKLKEQLKNYDKWEKIVLYLENELSDNLKKYIDIVNKKYDTKFFDKNYFTTQGFLFHKYLKNDGKFEYHHDYAMYDNLHRVIVYLWYLNDVYDGGETEIYNNILIKPEAGKLLLFPALWYYKHRGKMPLSNDKYVITGWFYTENKYLF